MTNPTYAVSVTELREEADSLGRLAVPNPPQPRPAPPHLHGRLSTSDSRLVHHGPRGGRTGGEIAILSPPLSPQPKERAAEAAR